MKQKRTFEKQKLINLSLLSQRIAYISLLLASILIMYIGKADLLVINKINSLVSDASYPMLSVFSKQTELVESTVNSIKSSATLKGENLKLIEENEKLKKYKIISELKEEENLSLRNQLNLIPKQINNFVSARAISAPGSVFAHTLLVHAGRKNGLEKGQAVLSNGSLIGQVINVGQITSRVLLISDFNSMIPSVVSGNRVPGLVSGENNQILNFKFLPKGFIPENGSIIQTSGHGGLLPPGIPIGKVISAKNGEVFLKSFESLNNIDFVQIVLWRADSVSLPQKLSSKNFKPIESKEGKNILEGMTFVGTGQ